MNLIERVILPEIELAPNLGVRYIPLHQQNGHQEDHDVSLRHFLCNVCHNHTIYLKCNRRVLHLNLLNCTVGIIYNWVKIKQYLYKKIKINFNSIINLSPPFPAMISLLVLSFRKILSFIGWIGDIYRRFSCRLSCKS